MGGRGFAIFATFVFMFYSLWDIVMGAQGCATFVFLFFGLFGKLFWEDGVLQLLQLLYFYFRFVWEIVVGGRGAEVLAKLTLAPPPVSSSAEAQCAKNIDQDYI